MQMRLLPALILFVKNVKQLNNAAGYVLRLRHGESVIYCVKKANADWATRKKKGMMNIFFTEVGLDIMDRQPVFQHFPHL